MAIPLLPISRPAEAAEARWDEINFETKEWKIPAARMKMNREHTVPLSDAALAILGLMKPLSSHREFIFPSRIKHTQPMNSQTVNAALNALDSAVYWSHTVYAQLLVPHSMSKASLLMLSKPP